MKNKVKELEKLTDNVVKWLAENQDPHTSIIITSTSVKMVQDVMGSPNITKYI